MRSRFIHALAQIQYNTLRDFSEDMEQSIKEQAKGYSDHMNELAKEYSDEHDLDIFWDYNSDRFKQLYQDYPNTLRTSLLISCITHLEKATLNIYNDLQENYDNIFVSLKSNRQLKGSLIEKAVQSLSLHLSLEDICKSKPWKNIIFYIQLRNRIIHDAGVVHPKHYEELFRKIKNEEISETKIVVLNEYHEIIMLENSSNKIIEDCEFFVKNLSAKIIEFNKLQQF
ncbi:hypothetical protein [Paenibacillus sp. Marseille-Q4541]|uniref:hypothetical protein n=1 Tax=Paenibacillus sp. Marseille-Q4541 TaxID=2831522 RepID=UPI001BA77F12|nr:hypothetical protein [Paenibacillus sp. Marseille-Q4541]